MSPYVSTPPGAGPSRTPVMFDERTGDLRIGEYGRHVADPAQPEQVYGAYLSLLYDVRRAKPGERLPLRAADLEALLLLVGDDPETIESRLVDLMGCTPAEAGILSRLLLRQRRATATLGIAAGLSLAGVGLVTQLTGGDEVVAPAAVEQSAAEQSASAPLVSAPLVSAPAAPEPVTPVSVPPAVVAPVTLAPAPAFVRAAPAPAPVVVGPQVPEPVAVEAPPAPVVVEAPPAAAPVLAAPAPVEVAPEDRYVLPLVEVPVMDAPPPVVVPESGIGEAVSLEPEVLEPISGIGGSGEHTPVEPISGVGEAGDHSPVEPEQPVAEAVEPEPVVVPEGDVPAELPVEQAPTDLQG